MPATISHGHCTCWHTACMQLSNLTGQSLLSARGRAAPATDRGHEVARGFQLLGCYPAILLLQLCQLLGQPPCPPAHPCTHVRALADPQVLATFSACTEGRAACSATHAQFAVVGLSSRGWY